MLASVTAAFAGVMLVLYEGHVQIVLGDRATYTSVFHHKCGLTMLATLAWAAFESVMFLAAVLRERREERERLLRFKTRASGARTAYPRRPSATRAAYPYAREAQTSAP